MLGHVQALFQNCRLTLSKLAHNFRAACSEQCFCCGPAAFGALCHALSLARGRRVPEGRDPQALQSRPPSPSRAPGRLTPSRGRGPDPAERGREKCRAGRRGGTAPTRPSTRSRPIHRAEPGRLSQSGAAPSPPRSLGATPTGAAPGRHDERSRGSTELTTAARLLPTAKLCRALPAGRNPHPASHSRPPRQGEWAPQCPPGPGSASEPCCPHRHHLPPAPRSSGVERKLEEAEPAARAATPQWAGGLPAAPRASRGALRAGAAAVPRAGSPRGRGGRRSTAAMPAGAPQAQLERAARPPSPFAFGKERRGSPDSSKPATGGVCRGPLSHLHENITANRAWDGPRGAFPSSVRTKSSLNL